MTTIRAAFYARVSSEQQAAAHTIESQTAALNERAQSDGTAVPPERQFVDDRYSGATLIRPALDRLRDLAAVGAIDRIYVHSPDRLARNYAYQVLLLDEWRRRGVEKDDTVDVDQLEHLRLAASRLRELAAAVGPHLSNSDWLSRRDTIRTLVQRIEIGPEVIKIVFRIRQDARESVPESIVVTLPRS